MVIYYKSGVTEKEISQFLQQALSEPYVPGYGAEMRHGICLDFRLREFQGHEATAVTFCQNATQAQENQIKADVLASPIVYKILENVVPSEVKKLE